MPEVPFVFCSVTEPKVDVVDPAVDPAVIVVLAPIASAPPPAWMVMLPWLAVSAALEFTVTRRQIARKCCLLLNPPLASRLNLP